MLSQHLYARRTKLTVVLEVSCILLPVLEGIRARINIQINKSFIITETSHSKKFLVMAETEHDMKMKLLEYQMQREIEAEKREKRRMDMAEEIHELKKKKYC